MYSVILKEDKFDILYNKDIILSDVSPTIQFDDKSVLNMKEINSFCIEEEGKLGKETRYSIEYIDEKSDVILTINFHCYEDFLFSSIELSAKSEMVGGICRGIEAFGGIRLKVRAVSEVKGLMANYMHKDWWTRPHFDREIGLLKPRTQSLVWKDSKGYNYLLPVCDDIFKTELCGDGSGIDIILSAYDGGHSNFKTVGFLLGAGENPYELSKKLVEKGMKLLGAAGKPREDRRYPDMLEYFGWCSWDAFYYDINERGIMDKAEEFKSLGLPAKWFIVDAGWSDDVDYHLNSFMPNKEKFPEGFRGMIDKLKEEYGLGWVGVWHTIIGYWNGIYSNGPIALEMGSNLYKTNAGKLIPYPEASRAFDFWNKWHSYLKQEGVDFVKVDYQSVLVNMLKNDIAIGRAAKEAHEALEASVGKNFDNRIINCMGMASENLWHRPVSPISRNSDDFFPKEKDNFKEHALQNAYNSFYHSNFIWGDWDMWWTNHEQAVNNAVLRAVSGGPVYVSDPVGTTVAEQLWPMMLKDGRILRCDQNGLPTEDCLFDNPQESKMPLKIWNKVKDSYVIAAFNINLKGETVCGKVSLKDIPVCKGDNYLVYERFTGKTKIMDRDNHWEFHLNDNELALFMFIPFELTESKFIPLGLVDKYISMAALDFYQAGKDKLVVSLKEGGTFGFAGVVVPERIIVNGNEAKVDKDKDLFLIDCSSIEGNILIEIE